MRIPQIISSGLRGESGRKVVWCSHGTKWRRKELWDPGSLQSGKEGKSTGCGKLKGAGSRARPQERSMAGCAVRAC